MLNNNTFNGEHYVNAVVPFDTSNVCGCSPNQELRNELAPAILNYLLTIYQSKYGDTTNKDAAERFIQTTKVCLDTLTKQIIEIASTL